MHVSTADALDINTLTLLIMMSVVTIAAIISDHIGCKPVLYFVAIGTLLTTRPLCWLMHHQDFTMILAGQLGFAILIGAAHAGLSATMVRILPTGARGQNFCIGLFGGTTPLVATYLVERTADDFTPAHYLMAAAVISLIAVFGCSNQQANLCNIDGAHSALRFLKQDDRTWKSGASRLSQRLL